MKELVRRYLSICKKLQQLPNMYIREVLETAGKSRVLSDTLSLNRSHEEHLFGKFAMLTDEDVKVLYHLLKNSTEYRTIQLRCNDITDKGAKWVSELLKDTVSLRALDLTFNCISPAGLEKLADGLLANETLRKIRMDGNKVGDAGGILFAQVLQIHPHLEELRLANTDMGIEGDSTSNFLSRLPT